MPDGDYYHFIWHDGLLYSADFEQPPEPPSFAERLGEVTCRFSGSTTPLDYSASREGEAGFLNAGTPYFSVSGFSSSKVIGAMYDGRPLLFKAGLDS